jgi:hypothetical protein
MNNKTTIHEFDPCIYPCMEEVRKYKEDKTESQDK